jgi:hypothetical protein
MSVVITDPPRVPADIAAVFELYGLATVHETQGRTDLLTSYMRPKIQGRLKATLGLYIHGMRDELARKGLTYRRSEEV